MSMQKTELARQSALNEALQGHVEAASAQRSQLDRASAELASIRSRHAAAIDAKVEAQSAAAAAEEALARAVMMQVLFTMHWLLLQPH